MAHVPFSMAMSKPKGSPHLIHKIKELLREEVESTDEKLENLNSETVPARRWALETFPES